MKRGHEEEHSVTAFANNFALFEQALQVTAFTPDEYAKIISFCQQKLDAKVKGERETALSEFLSNVTVDSFYADVEEVGEVSESEKSNEGLNSEIIHFLNTFDVSLVDLKEEDDSHPIFVFTIEGKYNGDQVKIVFRHKNAGGHGSYFYKEYSINTTSTKNVRDFIPLLKFSKGMTPAVFFRLLDFLFRNAYPVDWDDFSFALDDNR